MRADDLDRDHQRQREHHRPQHRETELGTGLRVGSDTARIVVRSTGDQARAELAQAMMKAEFADGLDSCILRSSCRPPMTCST
jgi:hypothetical protein